MPTMNRHFFRPLLLCLIAAVGLGAVSFGQTGNSPRLALQYWRAGDSPDWPVWNDEPVWVDGHLENSGQGHWEDFNGDGEEDGWVSEAYWVNGTWQSVWVEGDPMPDGAFGSSWETDAGIFNINSASSTWSSSGTWGSVGYTRGHLLFPYEYYDVITFRAWGLAPANNCNFYSYGVYRPDGSFEAGNSGVGWFYPGGRAVMDGSFFASQYGVWRIDVRYHNAVGVSPEAGTVSYYITVGSALTQTITFDPIPTHAFGDAPFALHATAASGLPVALSVVSGPATLSGDVITLTGNGAVTVRAAQAGGMVSGTFWNAAPPVDRTFSVIGIAQTISFAALPARTQADPPFALTATASSGLPVTFSVTAGPAIISGNVVSLTGAGTVVITAAQNGGGVYGPALKVSHSFPVSPVPPPEITSANAVETRVGEDFIYEFTFSRPVAYLGLSGTSVPPGLQMALNSSNVWARITGVPTTPGIYSYTATAVGPSGTSAPFSFVIDVKASNGLSVPTIFLHPFSQTVAAGANLSFTMGASGAFAYQWYKGSTALANWTFPVMFLNNVSAADVGSYSVRVFNSAGWVESKLAQLTVLGADGGSLEPTPTITAQPQAQTVSPGGYAYFAVTALSSSPLSYQWRKNGIDLVAETRSTLVLLGVSADHVGDYSVVVSNSAGPVTSSTAHLALDPRVQAITFYPLPNRRLTATPFPLRALASSGLPVYFSVLDGSDLVTVTGNILTINPGVTLPEGPRGITIRAIQPGNAAVDPAEPVERSFSIVDVAAAGTAQSVAVPKNLALAVSRPRAAAITGPVFRDFDGDGYLDEVIPAGFRGFNVSILQYSSSGGEDDNWVFAPYWDGSSGATSADRRTDWGLVPYFPPLPTIELAMVEYDFSPDPSHDYFPFEEYNHRYHDNVAEWPLANIGTRRGIRASDQEAGQPFYSNETLFDAAAGSSYYLIRIGKPLGLIQAALPGIGNVVFGSGRAIGTIKFPGVEIDVTPGGTGQVKVAGATVVFGSGTVRVNGPGSTNLPVGSGAAVTIPGSSTTVAVAGGMGTITIPGSSGGSTVINVNIGNGGGGSVSFPGGAGISVSRDGKVGLTLPAGAAPAILKAVDALGNVLPGVGMVLKNVLGIPTPLPSSGEVNPGDLPDTAVSNDANRTQIGQVTGVTHEPLYFFVDRQPASVATRSRDRFFTGSINTTVDRYRTGLVEFVRSTGEVLGAYRLDGSTGTHIYDSQDEILSDGELDAVVGGTLSASSPRMNQQVVFWRSSPGSSTIRFSTVFPEVGNIKIRITGGSGEPTEIPYTLTSEPNFGGLLNTFAERIRTLDMPATESWMLLPELVGEPDPDDDDYFAASSAAPSGSRTTSASRKFSLTAQPRVVQSSWAPWANNFVVKGATIADQCVTHAESNPGLLLKMGGNFLLGMVDGIWDGAKSDVEGITELAGTGWETIRETATLKGDYTRLKMIWDGCAAMLREVGANGGRKILDDMLTKIVDKAQVSVPWDAADPAGSQWSQFAYVQGYAAGFITEQIVSFTLGGKLIAHVGKAVKAAYVQSTLAKITPEMVSAAKHFTTCMFMSATSYSVELGREGLRSFRAAMVALGPKPLQYSERVAGLAVIYSSTVVEQSKLLVARMAQQGMKWKDLIDRAFTATKNEAQALGLRASIFWHVANLNLRLGGELTASGTNGFLNLWKGALRQGATSHCVEKLYAAFELSGPLEKASMARFLEMFDETGSAAYKFTMDATDPKKWISPKGLVYTGGDNLYGHRLIHVLQHAANKPTRVIPGGLPHGVFDAGYSGAFRAIDDAWVKVLANNTTDVNVTHQVSSSGAIIKSNYRIDMKGRVGFEGGVGGAATGNRAVNYMKIAVKNIREVITSFPEL